MDGLQLNSIKYITGRKILIIYDLVMIFRVFLEALRVMRIQCINKREKNKGEINFLRMLSNIFRFENH